MKPKYKLKSLNTDNVLIESHHFVDSITRLCPNIEILEFLNTSLSDASLVNGLKNLKKLKCIKFGQIQCEENVSSYEFLSHIPNEIASDVQLICVDTLKDNKIVNFCYLNHPLKFS